MHAMQSRRVVKSTPQNASGRALSTHPDKMAARANQLQMRLGVLFALACWLLWPALSGGAAAPPPRRTLDEEVAAQQSRPSALPATSGVVEAARTPATARPAEVHEFACREGHCNRCIYDRAHVTGKTPLKSVSVQELDMKRINGTQMTRAELADMGIRFLQFGGDWWNKCGDGWVNADAVFTRLPAGVVCEDWRTTRYVMRQRAEDALPFPDESIEAVYTEHMFEHILPMACAAFLKEAWRVLKPGGVIRITTPDLEKYLMGYAERKKGNTFLADHAARWPPMGKLGEPYTGATIVNNIFRNYEHQWVYDFEEMTRTAMHAGIPQSAVKRSTRLDPALPRSFMQAIHTAETIGSARHQKGAKEDPTRCWLEQEIREQESLYVLITKPAS